MIYWIKESKLRFTCLHMMHVYIYTFFAFLYTLYICVYMFAKTTKFTLNADVTGIFAYVVDNVGLQTSRKVCNTPFHVVRTVYR